MSVLHQYKPVPEDALLASGQDTKGGRGRGGTCSGNGKGRGSGGRCTANHIIPFACHGGIIHCTLAITTSRFAKVYPRLSLLESEQVK